MSDKVNECRKRPAPSALMAALLAVGLSYGLASESRAASRPAPPPPPAPAYARVADLVMASPAIAVLRVKEMTFVPPERSPGLGSGQSRFLVSAETQSLIRGNDVLARSANFLIDLPNNGDRKPPMWKGRAFLVFGTVEQRVDFFQLQSSTAMVPWSPENEAIVRRIASELAAPDAPPPIARITSAFHVSGAVQGEGETQIFLDDAKGSPISLSIIRRPDEKPQFGAALGEVVDEAAALPAPDTPLWYRLACGLPPELPPGALANLGRSDAAEASRDYRAFLAALAPCKREPAPLA